jgi:hypothetical protein
VDAKSRGPRVRCKHCEMTFPVPERIEIGNERRVQVQCPRKECGEWSWYERHELGLERERA